MIKYLDKNFNEEIKNKLILVDFYADWCGPCRMMGNVIENINEIDVLKVNVDKHPSLAQEYMVMSIPTLMLIENGKILKTNVGFMNEDEIREFIKK